MTRAYGPESLPVTLSIIGLHGAILLTVGMVTMELVKRDGQHVAAVNTTQTAVSNTPHPEKAHPTEPLPETGDKFPTG